MEPFVIILFVYGILYVLFGFINLPSGLGVFFPLPRFILILPGQHLSNPKVIKTARVIIGLIIIGLGILIQWKLANPTIPNA